MKQGMKDFLSFEKLYHFTNFDNALKIINSGQLKFGRLSNMNDASEKEKNIYNFFKGNSCCPDLEKIKKEVYNYEQISLTEDKMGTVNFGFELHQLWGLYADKSSGVCFIFDRQQLLENIGGSDEDIINGPVEYKADFTQELFTDISSEVEIVSWIRDNANFLFFTKRKEWEHEQEYRVMKRFEEHDSFHGIPVLDSLRYVVIFNPKTSSSHNFIENSLEYKLLQYFLPNSVPILSYECFDGEYQLIGKVREAVWNESRKIPFQNGEQIDVAN
jgi:hypothetical protein